MTLEIESEANSSPGVGAQVDPCMAPPAVATVTTVVLGSQITPCSSIIDTDLNLTEVIPGQTPPVPKPQPRILVRAWHGKDRTNKARTRIIRIVPIEHRPGDPGAPMRRARPRGRHTDLPGAVAHRPVRQRRSGFEGLGPSRRPLGAGKQGGEAEVQNEDHPRQECLERAVHQEEGGGANFMPDKRSIDRFFTGQSDCHRHRQSLRDE